MAPKLDIHEKCERCGETVARLIDAGIAWNPSACKCPKPPGPQAPPRVLSLHSANFIREETGGRMTDELQKLAEKTEGQMYHSQDVDDRRHNVGIILDAIQKAVEAVGTNGLLESLRLSGCIAELERELAAEKDRHIDTMRSYGDLVSEVKRELAKAQGQREEFAEGRDHLTVSGTFQSDKYAWCAAGFVPLKITDPAARDLLTEYARRRGAGDAAFSIDLCEALDRILAKPNDWYEPFKTVQELGREVACPSGKTWKELAEERWEQIEIGEGQFSKVKRELKEARGDSNLLNRWEEDKAILGIGRRKNERGEPMWYVHCHGWTSTHRTVRDALRRAIAVRGPGLLDDPNIKATDATRAKEEPDGE